MVLFSVKKSAEARRRKNMIDPDLVDFLGCVCCAAKERSSIFVAASSPSWSGLKTSSAKFEGVYISGHVRHRFVRHGLCIRLLTNRL